MIQLNNFYYITIDDDTYFISNPIQNKSNIVFDGILLDKKRHPLKSNLNTNLVISDYEKDHKIIKINLDGKIFTQTSFEDSLAAGIKK